MCKDMYGGPEGSTKATTQLECKSNYTNAKVTTKGRFFFFCFFIDQRYIYKHKVPNMSIFIISVPVKSKRILNKEELCVFFVMIGANELFDMFLFSYLCILVFTLLRYSATV